MTHTDMIFIYATTFGQANELGSKEVEADTATLNPIWALCLMR